MVFFFFSKNNIHYLNPIILDDRQIDLIERTDEIFRAIGINYPASIQTPVEGGVKTTQFISMFLNEVFFFSFFFFSFSFKFSLIL